jgi:hypothetical protein
MRFPFIADHAYYEKRGLYDFPNVDPQANKFSLAMIEAVKDPQAKEISRKMIGAKMVEPLQKIVETKILFTISGHQRSAAQAPSRGLPHTPTSSAGDR